MRTNEEIRLSLKETNEDYLFNNLIKNKNVFHIPIVSMSDHVNRIYNLSCDGNVNRLISNYTVCNSFKSLTILFPNKSTGQSFVNDQFEKMRTPDKENSFNKKSTGKINVYYSNNIPDNAKDHRIGDVESLHEEIMKMKEYEDADIIIVESQKLAQLLIYENSLGLSKFKEIWYWCPTCATHKHERDFQIPYKDYDDKLFEACDGIIVASNEQKEFIKKSRPWKKVILYSELMRRSLKSFDYEIDNDIIDKLIEEHNQIIYLPFRLSDPGYKADFIVNTLYELFKNNIEFVVWYSDPNASNFIENFIDKIEDNEYKEKFKNIFKHVSSERNVYYTILDYGDTIIPYLEDLEFINHCAIYEFIDPRSTAKVILKDDLELDEKEELDETEKN